MPKIDAPDELTIPPVIGGVSQETYDSISFWNTRGITVNDLPGGRAEVELPRYLLTLGAVERWCSLGSEVFDYDVWHELDDITKPCPYSETDPQETWETWGVVGQSHKPIEIEGKWYRSNAFGAGGERVVASKWYGFIDNPEPATTGILRMLTVEEFQAIQDAAAPPPPTPDPNP